MGDKFNFNEVLVKRESLSIKVSTVLFGIAWGRKMSAVEIDEIDVKILKSLIKDSRTNLKEIARECGVSSNAIFKRIRNLEKNGVITGYSLIAARELGNFESLSTIWLTIDLAHELEAVEFLKRQEGLFNIFRCVGRYDIVAYCLTKNIQKLEDILQKLKKQEWVKAAVLNIWTQNGKLTLENVEITPTREGKYAR
ncbi:MAG: Lrp/AsnC family transcriptional regulator [Candidatus Bathyarchaeota archaeon]|nr:Lrp/AsnC family transcriptional regulator [Candidatus Bathyarchaeota archaeon]